MHLSDVSIVDFKLENTNWNDLIHSLYILDTLQLKTSPHLSKNGQRIEKVFENKLRAGLSDYKFQ